MEKQIRIGNRISMARTMAMAWAHFSRLECGKKGISENIFCNYFQECVFDRFTLFLSKVQELTIKRLPRRP